MESLNSIIDSLIREKQPPSIAKETRVDQTLREHLIEKYKIVVKRSRRKEKVSETHMNMISSEHK